MNCFFVQRCILAIIFLFFFISVSAQPSLDIATISGRYGVPQNAGKPTAGKSIEYGSLVNLKIPIVLSNKTIWYNSATYLFSHVESDAGLSNDIAHPLDIQGFIFQSGIVQTINSKQKIQLLFSPRFMSDFENTTSKNWQLGGLILFENRYSKNFMLRFGALYNNELFGPALTPLLYTNWKISAKWNIVGMLPIYLKVNYKVNKNLTTGFSHFALITTYLLGNVNYQNDYIERTSIDLTLFARHKILENIFIEGRFGFAVDRKYEQYAEDQQLDLRLMVINFGDNRVVKNQLMRDGLIANVRLVYNLPLE